jgi:hypothetical protein
VQGSSTGAQAAKGSDSHGADPRRDLANGDQLKLGSMSWQPTPREIDGFRDCVDRLKLLTAEELGNVVILLFHYWVKIVLPR